MKNFNSKKNKFKYCFVVISLVLINFHLKAQPHSHDPCKVMRDGNKYWVFKTAAGIGAMSATSADFSDWQSEPSVFGDTWPEWINDYVPDFAGEFWAPSCIYMNGKYYLYYSCSTSGSSLSAIGVATTPSLNDSAWTDQGMVVYSDGSGTGTVNNAIDPALFKDDDGRVWMTYGSWFGGITLTEIDTSSGKAIGDLTQLAGGNHTDIEAPFIMKHDTLYYLFVNRGLCCRGVNSTYYIEVGRSDSVTGPYEDWQTLLETDGRWIGPGHFGYNEGRLGYHVYDAKDEGATAYLNTTLSWVDGWPMAGDVSQESQGDYVYEGTYRIMTNDTTKVLAVANNTPANLSNVEIQNYTDPDVTGQSWNITNNCFNENYLTPENYPTLSMEILNCVITDSANIDLYTYWEGECQQWIFQELNDSVYQIRSNLSNKCIEIEGTTISNGSNVILNSCDTGNENQQFKLKLLELTEDTTSVDSFPVVLSYTSEQCSNPASNIIDGDTSNTSRWSTEGFPKVVIIDYGTEQEIAGVHVWTYKSRAYQYKVEFDDNLDFSSPFLLNRASNTTTNQPIADYFDEVLYARYARLTITGAASSSIEWVGINEFAIVSESEVPSGISDVKSSSFSLYPNPVKDAINITFSSNTEGVSDIRIFNVAGQLVVTDSKISGKTTAIDVSVLIQGVYCIVISNNKNTEARRFVKQ